MDTKEFIAYIYGRCKEMDEDFLTLNKIALRRIDEWRCPLSSACPQLDDIITEAVEDYLDEKGLDWDDLDIDNDEIFWSDEWSDLYVSDIN